MDERLLVPKLFESLPTGQGLLCSCPVSVAHNKESGLPGPHVAIIAGELLLKCDKVGRLCI